MNKIDIGKKIADFRRKNNMTIRELSEKSSISTALLSQIERNIANPSLSVLSALAETIGMPLSRLLEEEVSNESLILRSADKKTVFDPGDKHILYNILTKDPVFAKVELLLMTLKAKQETFGGFSEHIYEEEITYILNGKVTIIFEEEEFILYEGDTIRILPGRKHRFRNELSEESKVLFVKCKID